MTPQQDSLSGVIICPAYRRTAVKGELRHHNQHDSIHTDTASNQASRASGGASVEIGLCETTTVTNDDR